MLAIIKEGWAYNEECQRRGLPSTLYERQRLQARARWLRAFLRPTAAMQYAKNDYKLSNMRPRDGLTYRPGEEP